MKPKTAKKYSGELSRSDASDEITQKIETAMLDFNITYHRARDFVMLDPANAELVRLYIFGE